VIRVVLDANVVISGAGRFEQPVSPPAHLIRLALSGAFALFASAPLIEEVERTLDEPYFIQRVGTENRQGILAFLRECSLDALSVVVTGVASQPADDLILSTALSASADVLVTGDRMLLKLGSYEGVAIMSPAAFLDFIGSQK
jgi:putative PIN family toxin of toxin-antitoxin system